MGWGAPAGDLAGDVADGLNQTTGHPADGRQQLADGKSGKAQATRFGGLETVLTFAGRSPFQLVIYLVANSACFFDRLLHRKNKTWDRLIWELVEADFFKGNGANAVSAAGFPKVGVTFARVNENDGDLGSMAISLADHLGGGAELLSGPGDSGGGTQTAQLEFEYGGGVVSSEGNGIQFAEPVASAMVVVVFGVLVAKDTLFPEVEVAREDGADAELGRKANDGEGGGLDTDFALALAFPASPKSKALRPAKIF